MNTTSTKYIKNNYNNSKIKFTAVLMKVTRIQINQNEHKKNINMNIKDIPKCLKGTNIKQMKTVHNIHAANISCFS